MNEIRNIIIGFELGAKTSQLCVYDRKEKEPISLSPKTGSNQYEFPTALSKKRGEEVWHFGLEAVYFADQQGEQLVEPFYEICQQEKEVLVDGKMRKPSELIVIYVTQALSMLGVAQPLKQMSALMITTKELTGAMVRNLQKAYQQMGCSPKRVFMQDYEESFYYYAMNQKQEYRNRLVAWFTFEENQVSYAQLSIDAKTKPMMAAITKGRSISLAAEEEQRDTDFYELIQESFGTNNFASIYMVGEGFEKKWAVRSIPLLCKNQRHVFYGNNLFVKGACYAAREKVEEKDLKAYLYAGNALIRNNVGMEMLVQGSKAYYPMIEAGSNWYEANSEVEIILDDKEELTFQVAKMDSKVRTRYSMQLPDLPQRANRTIRLHVHLAYESARDCVITVTDMGFGELFPSSGKIWTEKVTW